jgi:hypothetical protein
MFEQKKRKVKPPTGLLLGKTERKKKKKKEWISPRKPSLLSIDLSGNH